MKMPLLLFLFSALLFGSCCLFGNCDDDDDDDCNCPSTEICVDGNCELPPGEFRLGAYVHRFDRMYFGILPDRFCIDTLLFAAMDDREDCLVFTSAESSGPLGVGTFLVEQFTVDHFHLAHLSPLCEDNDRPLKAAIECRLFEPDNVDLKLRFFYDDDDNQEIIIIDSTQLTLQRVR